MSKKKSDRSLHSYKMEIAYNKGYIDGVRWASEQIKKKEKRKVKRL